MRRKGSFLIMVLAVAMLLVGCETMQQTGTLVGAGTGAVLGGLASGGHHHGWPGALLGAVAGAIIGNQIGEIKDTNQAQNAAIVQAQRDANTVVVNVPCSDGSANPVHLERRGDVWYGPQGEMYQKIPSADVLKSRYGR